MVVDTRKFGHTTFYESRDISERDKVNRYVSSPSELFMLYNMYWKSASHLPARIRAKADFIIADTSKGSFKVVEMKKRVGRVGIRQIPSYLRMPVIAGERYILRPKTDVHYGGILVHEKIETLPELVKTARPIEIFYPNQSLVETLLGSKGKFALGQVVSIVKNLAQERDWPLDRIEVRHVHDPEVKDWEYVLLLLVFTCDFDTADRHLHELYDQIDVLTGKLGDEEREILRRVVFFDIETKDSISSA